MKRVSFLLLIIIVILLFIVDSSNQIPETVSVTEAVSLNLTNTPTPIITPDEIPTDTQIITKVVAEEPMAQDVDLDTLPEVNYPYPLEVISTDNFQDLELLETLGDGHFLNYALSPDESLIAVYTSTGIHVYETMTLEEQYFLEFEYPPTEFYKKWNLSSAALDFDPQMEKIVFTKNHGVYFWNLLSNEIENNFIYEISDYIPVSVEFSFEGNHLVIRGRGSYAPCEGPGSNFSIYNVSGQLKFNTYVCDAYGANNYYRITEDNKVYFFFLYGATLQPVGIHVFDLDTDLLVKSIMLGYEEYILAHNLSTFDFKKELYYDVSPDGKLLASMDYVDEKLVTYMMNSNTREVIDTVDGRVKFIINENNEVEIQQDISTYYVDSELGQRCNLLDRSKSEFIELMNNEDLHLVIIRDDNKFQTLELWNIESCQIENWISFLSASEIKFSPDGKYILSLNSYDLNVWNTNDFSSSYSVRNDPYDLPIDLAEFSSDGQKLVTGTYNKNSMGIFTPNRISVWDLKTGKLINEIDSGGDSLFEIKSHPTPELISVRDENNIRIININSGEIISTFSSGNYVFSNEGNLIWIAAGDEWDEKRVKAYDVYSEILQYYSKRKYPINEIFYNEYSDQIIAFNRNLMNNCEEIWVFSSDSGELFLQEIKLENSNYGNYFRFLKQAQYIVVFNLNEAIAILSTETNEVLAKISDLTEYDVTYVELSPNGDYLIVPAVTPLPGEFWDSILIFDTGNGDLIDEKLIRKEIEFLQISPDGKLIAIVGEDGLLYLYGVRAGE